MSLPPPVTMKVPALYVAVPGRSGRPTSIELHPAGRGPGASVKGVTDTLENVAIALVSAWELVTASPT